jgi:hypothetical protein
MSKIVELLKLSKPRPSSIVPKSAGAYGAVLGRHPNLPELTKMWIQNAIDWSIASYCSLRPA